MKTNIRQIPGSLHPKLTISRTPLVLFTLSITLIISACGTPLYSKTDKDWLDYFGSAITKSTQNQPYYQPPVVQKPLVIPQQQRPVVCYKLSSTMVECIQQ